MQFKVFTIVLLIGMLSIPVFAQEDAHSVSFDGFSFRYDAALAQNLNVLHYPGDPVEGADAGFSDAANTIFNLYNASPAPESPLDAQIGIRLYTISDLAQYDFMQAVVDDLQTIIADRPDLATYETSSGAEGAALPFLPVPIHGQTLRTHAEYVATEQMQGISYIVTSPTLDGIEPFNSASFRYVFQGISTDGQHYISAIALLTTPLFPAEITSVDMEDLSQNWETILAESATVLDEAQPSDFTPALDTFDPLIESFRFAAR